jgi:hypothetical protein
VRRSISISDGRLARIEGLRAPLPTRSIEVAWNRVPGVTVRLAAKSAGPHLTHPRAVASGLFSVAIYAFEVVRSVHPTRRREPLKLQLPYCNLHRPENGNVSAPRTPGSDAVQSSSTKPFTSIS